MTDSSSEFSSVVRLREFVEKRATQVADLLQVVDNAKLVSGEVTKGPRTAAQRLPRHMRRRAMAYEIRRFPKGLRNFAAPFLISNHRKKPPCRYFRRRSRNLLLNYIRRQRKSVWLETHIWHAKRFHMTERWGYRIPDRSFQRNFRSVFRASMKHCTVRDKSYLSCILITGECREALIAKLKPFCEPAAGPTFAFKSAASGNFEVSTLLYEPGLYPHGLIGPARFLWSSESGRSRLSLWVHPSCREQLLSSLTKHLHLEKNAIPEIDENFVPSSVEEWRLKNTEIRTQLYHSSDNAITVEDLKDQLCRFRFYGPFSLPVLRNCLRLVEIPEGNQFSPNHSEWKSFEGIGGSQFQDGRVFSLLVEDPRIAFPEKRTKPSEAVSSDEVPIPEATPLSLLWCRDARIAALKHRLPDGEMNKLKGQSVEGVLETLCKVPVLVVIRNLGSGKTETLEGVELIAPAGFGRDLWVSAQLNTAHASGRRDDLAAHLESRCLEFPTDYVDCEAGTREMQRIQRELLENHLKKPHNRRVLHWKNMSVTHPFSFEFAELLGQWTKKEGHEPYVLRDRRSLVELDEWLRGKRKIPEGIITSHPNGLVAVQLKNLARGKPKRYALVCLPTKEDLQKMTECRRNGKPFILTQRKRNAIEEEVEKMDIEENGVDVDKEKWQNEMWKDVVSLDQAAREKPIPLKPLFPDTKNMDKALKRKRMNRVRKEKAKKRKVEQVERLEELNKEEEEKKRCGYRYGASRETLGRVIRGDYSFTAGHGLSLALIPLCVLEKISSNGGVLFVRNISSKYYHPVKTSILQQNIEL